MPHIDLEPGDYSERKPKGWRWRLPWSHKHDLKLPLVMLVLTLGFVAYFFIYMPDEMRPIAGGVALFAFLAGAFAMWVLG